jgi:hypothetical protein
MRITRIPARPGYAAIVAGVAMVAGQPAVFAAELMAAARSSIQAEDAKRHVCALADDAFEGREGGSRGGRAAGSYIISHLEKLGLEPPATTGASTSSFGGMRNILALARGSDPSVANELIVGAHYDHVGYGNSRQQLRPLWLRPQRCRRQCLRRGRPDRAGRGDAAPAGPTAAAHPVRLLGRRGKGTARLLSLRAGAARNARPDVGRLFREPRHDRPASRRKAGGFWGPYVRGLRAAAVRPTTGPVPGRSNSPSTGPSPTTPTTIRLSPPESQRSCSTRGLHDQYHRPSDDVHLVNFDGIEPVTRLTLDFVMALANDPGPVRSFRPQARSESDATKRALEAPAVSPAPTQAGDGQGKPVGNQRPRWGMGTRADPGEPANPVIVRIAQGSPAAQGGMMLGDRVLAVDGTAVTNQADMVTRLAAAGNRVALDVDRKGRVTRIVMDVDVTDVTDAVQP